MKNSVFHGKEGRVHASGLRFPLFALLLALFIVLLCGCDEKATDNATLSDGGGSVVTETPEGGGNVGAETPEGGGDVGAETPEGGGNVGTETPEGGGDVEGWTPEGGGNVEGWTPEGGGNVEGWTSEGGGNVEGWTSEGGGIPPQIPQSPDSDELIIKIDGISSTIVGFSDVIRTINEKIQSFDNKLTQILNQKRSGVSMPVFIASILGVFVLNAGLTAFVVSSFTRKFSELEEKLDKQSEEISQRDEDLKAAIAKTATQDGLLIIAKLFKQYMSPGSQNTGAQNAQAIRNAQNAQSVQNAQAAQNVKNAQSVEAPKKSFYQAFPRSSNAEPTILDKSETNQPLVGWMSSGTLILEPSLDKEGTCSRDALYSEQVTACFSVRPPDPVDSLDFYRVEIVEPAKATPYKGKYVLSARGRLTART